MVIFFEEQDLLSFGEFIISDKRREIIEEVLERGDKVFSVDARLRKVTDQDLSTWVALRSQQIEQHGSKD